MIQEVFQVYQQKWIQSIQFQARTREPGRQIVKVAPGHLVKIVHYDFAAAATVTLSKNFLIIQKKFKSKKLSLILYQKRCESTKLNHISNCKLKW